MIFVASVQVLRLGYIYMRVVETRGDEKIDFSFSLHRRLTFYLVLEKDKKEKDSEKPRECTFFIKKSTIV